MWRSLTRLAPLAALLALAGSSRFDVADFVSDHVIALTASPLPRPEFISSKRLRFVAGWRLESRDSDFGGLSALLVEKGGLTTLSDKGVVVEIGFARGAPVRARLRSLPAGCGQGLLELDHDTESLARDRVGNVWIGYEWRNAICKLNLSFDRAQALAAPGQMRHWPKAGGAEAMTALRDGRTIVLAERSNIGREWTPLLIYSGDPTDPGATALELAYWPPAGYRPTDIAELPDGSLLILHRRFKAPLSFATILSVLPGAALAGPSPLRSRPLALLKAPGLNDNFEGLAIEQRAGRIFVWMISDDNFSPWQETYLLKFELLRA